jgi:hypothetical protein
MEAFKKRNTDIESEKFILSDLHPGLVKELLREIDYKAELIILGREWYTQWMDGVIFCDPKDSLVMCTEIEKNKTMVPLEVFGLSDTLMAISRYSERTLESLIHPEAVFTQRKILHLGLINSNETLLSPSFMERVLELNVNDVFFASALLAESDVIFEKVKAAFIRNTTVAHVFDSLLKRYPSVWLKGADAKKVLRLMEFLPSTHRFLLGDALEEFLSSKRFVDFITLAGDDTFISSICADTDAAKNWLRQRLVTWIEKKSAINVTSREDAYRCFLKIIERVECLRCENCFPSLLVALHNTSAAIAERALRRGVKFGLGAYLRHIKGANDALAVLRLILNNPLAIVEETLQENDFSIALEILSHQQFTGCPLGYVTVELFLSRCEVRDAITKITGHKGVYVGLTDFFNRGSLRTHDGLGRFSNSERRTHNWTGIGHLVLIEQIVKELDEKYSSRAS